MDILETARTAVEIAARQVWFRLPETTQHRIRPLLSRPRAEPAILDLARLGERLDLLAPGAARLWMVHASADAFRVKDPHEGTLAGPMSALAVLRLLLGRIGDSGTICMPTHPLYTGDRGFLEDKSDLRLLYRPSRTPSSVGILSELFRRDGGTRRSLHPLCSLAARGPRAEELLAGNLDGDAPLPHGVQSGYHRFCQMGGTVFGLGVRLLPFATVLHCAEEAADTNWQVADFFRLRTFQVEFEPGDVREVRVRERRPEFVRALALGRLRRDALAEGVLRESQVDGVPVDVLDAKGLFELMIARQASGPYPFVLPRLAVRSFRRHPWRKLETTE